MAKHLIYNYTFTPGTSLNGTIVVEGNYPVRTWQLVTNTGTAGDYNHTFVRDDLASSTGAIDIISGGSGGNLIVAESGTSYDPVSGIMTVTTTTSHGLVNGDTIQFRQDSLIFTCEKDGNNAEKSYPRTTDPTFGQNIVITKVDADTFTCFVSDASTDNEIIYNFSDKTLSGSTYYNSVLDTTTMTLLADTSDMDYRDELQIFVDKQHSEIEFSETFIDPVSKLRVSNPQNLIDTDFEYGLQPTKWETIELVNQVPSFYSNSSDYSIADVTSVETFQDSTNVTVNTVADHGLVVGAPIDVQGLSSRTAEGKYLITAVPSDNSFVYRATKKQEKTGRIDGSYTVITPGQFYNGSEIQYNEEIGIETDGNEPSTLQLYTNYVHGFVAGSSLYFTNTIGSLKYTIEETATDIAPDGRPYVDFSNTATVNFNPDVSQTETRVKRSTYTRKFKTSDVDTANNAISWPNHRLRQGDAVLYSPPAGDAAVGGLQRFQIYYVKDSSNPNAVTLCETTNGQFNNNPEINITSAGTSSYGFHALMLCYEMGRVYSYSGYQTRIYSRRYYFGSGSGWDLQNYSFGYNNGRWVGLGQQRPGYIMMMDKKTSTELNYNSFKDPIYSTRSNSNFTFNKGGTVPDGYEFTEDWQRWDQYSTTGDGTENQVYATYGRAIIYQAHDYRSSYSNQYGGNYSSGGRWFWMYMTDDGEADSFFYANHGLEDQSSLTVTIGAGASIRYRTDTGTTYNTTPTFGYIGSGTTHSITVIGDDRFKINTALRLSSASGTYTFAGEGNNPLKNSFYINDSRITNRQMGTIGVGVGGSIPTSLSGPVIPTVETIDVVHEAVKAKMEEVRTATGGDAIRMLYDGSSNNGYAPFQSWNSNTDGGIQYISHYRYNMYIYLMNTSGSTNSYYSGSLSSKPNWGTGTRQDLFSTTSLQGLGFDMIETPYTHNTFTNYWYSIKQFPDLSNIGLTVNGLPVNRARWDWSSYWSYCQGTYGQVNANQNANYTNYDTSIGNGWRYNYVAKWTYGGNYNDYIQLSLVIDNSNWPGYYNNISGNHYFTPWYNLQPRDYTYGGQRYVIDMVWPLRNNTQSGKYGPSGSTLTHAQIANTVAAGIAASMTSTELVGGVVQFEQLNSVRFALRDPNDTQYDITNPGMTPLIFTTLESTGGVDGFYGIDVVGAGGTQMQSFSSGLIPKRVIGFSSEAIAELSSVMYINIPNHKMQNNQRFVYTNDGTGSIPGLTNEATYHALVSGPDHIQVADGPDGSPIGIGTTGVGNFTLTVPSVAGISSAVGTVAISTVSPTVVGTDTLFRRFFKAGDSFKVNDTTISPPTYTEFIVDSVIDDTNLTVTTQPTSGIQTTSYYVTTKINTRPDGAFLHRPFDGGVEIDAGTSPNSSIVRQTRKYFRYQSGKGIQCSLAINFNPSRVATSLVSSANTSLPSEVYRFTLANNQGNSWNVSGAARDGQVFGENPPINIVKGDYLTFTVNAPGQPLWIKTAPTTGVGNSVAAVGNGTDAGTITLQTDGLGIGTYYYQSENSAPMGGLINIEAVGSATTIAKVTTKYPHGITRVNQVTIKGSEDQAYNGTFQVRSSTDFTFRYYISDATTTSVPNGIIEYNVDSWQNSKVRCGLFDYQNGMFFEFDGETLWAVRRSSVQQLPGTGAVTKGSNIMTGTDTNFSGQLVVGDKIVIRGQSHRITHIPSKTVVHMQPSYQGVDAADIIITKTVDIRVEQSEWNIDRADGTGPSGFLLDLTKIQMCYLDYSWYGAGKIRFGFKDTYGHVKYMHEFRHNNRLEEAYMRTGNIAGRYEIENEGIPTYVPSLFHWGTSIIMDGKFDDDKAYLFTAPSKTLVFTNGDSNAVTTNGNSALTYRGGYYRDYYVRIPFNQSDQGKFSAGAALYTADFALNGTNASPYPHIVDYTDFNGGNFNVYIYVGSYYRWQQPGTYPYVANGTAVNVGAPASGAADDELVNKIPLVSIRLAPSVDNNLTGALGAREIINRMQLQMKSLGITLTHDCTVDLILNGASSNRTFSDVASPSLSELVQHAAGDKIVGGSVIYSLRASGGAEASGGRRLPATSDFDLSQITDLGNAILGGDGTYPNGPDLLTIAIAPVDTASINADSPLEVSSRISWTESQA